MKFRDTKIVKYEGYSFEHAHIVQGIMIYAVFLGLLSMGMLDRQKTAYIILTFVVLAYICITVYYLSKGKKLVPANKLALLRLITLPTSMLG